MLLFIGNIFVVVVIAITVLMIVLMSLFLKWYKKPTMGKVIIRTGSEGAKVCFEKGIFIIPVLHHFELLDITMKTFSIDLSRHDAILLEDGLKVEVIAVFYIRIPRNREDVIKVATTIGCERASKKETIKELFFIKFSEFIKDVAANLGAKCNDKTRFKETLLQTIGHDLNGFVLDDCVIEYLKVTESVQAENKEIL